MIFGCARWRGGTEAVRCQCGEVRRTASFGEENEKCMEKGRAARC